MSPAQPLSTRPQTAAISLGTAMDICCCFFLSAGVLLAVYKLLPLWPPFPWACAAFPALTLAVIAVGGRRGLAAMAALLAALMLITLLRLPGWWEMLRAFVRYWGTGLSPAYADLTYNDYLLLRALPALTITLGLWLMIRRRLPFWLLLVACLAVLAALSFYGKSDYSASLYLLAAGLLPMAAAGGKGRDAAARGLAAAFALPLSALALAAVFFTLPEDTAGLRWPPLANVADRVQQGISGRFSGSQQSDSAATAYELPGSYQARLGGPINQSNTRILIVQTDSQLLLKAAVFDYYTGHSWEKSAPYLARLYNRPGYDPDALSESAVPFLPGQDGEALNRALGFVPSPNSNHPLAPFARQAQATVTLLRSQGPYLPYAGRPLELKSANAITPLVEENSELKSLLPPGSGDSYEFTALSLDRTRNGFTNVMATLTESLAEDDLALNTLSTAELNRYRQLPVPLVIYNGYADILQMIVDIVNDGLPPGEQQSSYEQAVRLEAWLKENCRYTLTPDTPPRNEDFVLHFLQTREGYCAYYASAMVIMSRMIGIPARYVTGYNLKQAGDPNSYEATQATMHAWAELFFAGAGWLPFDATGQANFTELRGLHASTAEREHFGPGLEENAATTPLISRQLLQTALIATAAAALLLALLLMRARLAYRLSRLSARFSPAAILNLYYRDLLGQLSLLGWQRYPSETVIAFARRMGLYLPAPAGQLRQLAVAVSALRYGGEEPTPEDLRNAEALHGHCEDMIRRQLKRPHYYAYRLRHGPTAADKR